MSIPLLPYNWLDDLSSGVLDSNLFLVEVIFVVWQFGPQWYLGFEPKTSLIVYILNFKPSSCQYGNLATHVENNASITS